MQKRMALLIVFVVAWAIAALPTTSVGAESYPILLRTRMEGWQLDVDRAAYLIETSGELKRPYIYAAFWQFRRREEPLTSSWILGVYSLRGEATIKGFRLRTVHSADGGKVTGDQLDYISVNSLAFAQTDVTYGFGWSVDVSEDGRLGARANVQRDFDSPVVIVPGPSPDRLRAYLTLVDESGKESNEVRIRVVGHSLQERRAPAARELSSDERSVVGPVTPYRLAREGKLKELETAVDGSIALINKEDARGRTALHGAAQGGHPRVVRFLISEGALVDSRDQFGETPLMVAVREGPLRVVTLLLEAGANPMARAVDGRQAIHDASNSGDLALARTLLAAGAKATARNWQERVPMHLAAGRGDVPMMSLLLEEGAAVDSRTRDGETPLWSAIWTQKVEAVRFLLERGADANASKEHLTALHSAVGKGSLETVKALLNAGSQPDSVDSTGSTPLHVAARVHGRAELAEALLRAGADPNRADKAGDVPMDVAMSRENVWSARVLADHGADLTIFSAAFVGNNEVLDRLLGGQRGWARDGHDMTALHWAVRGRNTETVALLIERGADVNARAWLGWTPLHMAVSENDLEVARLLVTAGASPLIEDLDGSSALDYAQHRPEMRRILIGTPEQKK